MKPKTADRVYWEYKENLCEGIFISENELLNVCHIAVFGKTRELYVNHEIFIKTPKFTKIQRYRGNGIWSEIPASDEPEYLLCAAIVSCAGKAGFDPANTDRWYEDRTDFEVAIELSCELEGMDYKIVKL